MRSKRESRRHLMACWLGAGWLTGIGVVLVALRLGQPLARLSYDLPFWLHRSPPVSNVVLVYIDERTLERYGGRDRGSLDRAAQDRLLKKLTAEHARLVFYDFVFDFTNQPPEVDDLFAATMTRHGAVVLGADWKQVWEGSKLIEEIRAPVPVLRRAAKWGLIDIESDADNAVRKMPLGTVNYPNAVWVAAQMLGSPVAQHSELRRAERWLNYYGPPRTDTIPYQSFEAALEPHQVPEGYFSNKIVIVCPHHNAPTIGRAADEFPNPYSRMGFLPPLGAEIHATALLNLLRNEWLVRMGFGWQLLVVTMMGLGLGLGLTRLQPWNALWVASAFCIAVALATFYVQWVYHVWWSWLVPALVQAPLAVLWSVGAHYVLETRQRLRLRRAFAAYLSPEMADQISQSDFDLSLGGKVVEVTIMFTDLEGFTSISESLEPELVSRLLTTYFNQTSKTVLQRHGTIIKYIGDSIMAVWGAPIPDVAQAEQAALAAWEMVQAGRQEIIGHKLRTRVGIHSGRALAGNLGSDVRFDYTVIGDTTNCASRLESANKYFGTEILLSEATRRQLSGQIRTRRLGRFRLAGRAEPMEIHELLGPADWLADGAPWVDQFESAVGCFCARELDRAEMLFREVIRLRGGSDGPSQLYLVQIEAARETTGPAAPWTGVVEMVSK